MLFHINHYLFYSCQFWFRRMGVLTTLIATHSLHAFPINITTISCFVLVIEIVVIKSCCSPLVIVMNSMLLMIKFYADSLQLILLLDWLQNHRIVLNNVAYALFKLKKGFLKRKTCNDSSSSKECHSQPVIGKKCSKWGLLKIAFFIF